MAQKNSRHLSVSYGTWLIGHHSRGFSSYVCVFKDKLHGCLIVALVGVMHHHHHDLHHHHLLVCELYQLPVIITGYSNYIIHDGLSQNHKNIFSDMETNSWSAGNVTTKDKENSLPFDILDSVRKFRRFSGFLFFRTKNHWSCSRSQLHWSLFKCQAH